jgi:predicted Rossmann fold nucleotide-binding protein DprA/Smf involved in DNA uptake
MMVSVDVTIVESESSQFPQLLRNGTVSAPIPRIWTIGNLKILERRLLGFLCSTKCPGDAILQTYDLIRALRDASVTVIGGFHSPMEKECLDLLLRGKQPVVICPARSIVRLRLPTAWRRPLVEDRLLVLSPFEAKHRRPTAELAEQRNRFVAALSDEIFIAHAATGSKTEQFCRELLNEGKRVLTLQVDQNRHLLEAGVGVFSL